MPRNGAVALNNLAVQSVFNSAASSRLVMKVGNWTVTIERDAKLPDDVNPRPGDTLDLAIGYDPKL